MLREIGRLAVFIICAQTISHFRAKESYEKYIKLLVSIMILFFLLKSFWGAEVWKEEDILEQFVTGYERELVKDDLFVWGQEEMEKVALSMAEEAIAQEEIQEAAMPQEINSSEGIEVKEGDSYSILVETIQIGE